MSDMKKRFDKRGFGVNAYAKAYGVDPSILSKVLQEKFDGSKGHRGGAVRRIIAQLKKDGVWRGRLPWEAVSWEEI